MVSELLSKLRRFKEQYLNEKVIPDLSDPFNLSLFNTFRSYIEPDYYPVQYDLKTDDRGTLFEAVRSLNQGQVFFSYTKPGIERGNHYHRRKLERFSIIKGKALVRLRRIGTEKIVEYTLNGDTPSYVDIPIHHTHNLINVGEEDLLILFWASELFNPDYADTYYEKVDGGPQ
jgi:UDP-2-acetamido-2,6-beta-L-arabino-hexul-4-ose reductase